MFTFKTVNPTGKYRGFYNPYHFVKLKKIVVGEMNNLTHTIRLKVIKDDINEDNNPNCTWKWITLKRKSSSVADAKEFLKQNYDAIVEKYNLAKDE